MKPETVEVAVAGTLTARSPGFRTAARKPREPGMTMSLSTIGAPTWNDTRATAPTKSLICRLPSMM